jgi:hypothetical protein
MKKFLPLSVILKLVAQMEQQGVSKIARSPRGFLTAYRRARGNHELLNDGWIARREAFIARHMAQLVLNNESLYDKSGNPTRRHLALVAWAYSPDPKMKRMS